MLIDIQSSQKFNFTANLELFSKTFDNVLTNMIKDREIYSLDICVDLSILCKVL